MRVILDCDPGNGIPAADIDDGLALGLILKSPEFQLEAVTVAAGNTPVDDGVRCGLWMLETAGVDVPLHRGTTGPLLEDPSPWRAGLDTRKTQEPANTMWRDVPRPTPRGTAAAEGAAEAIVRIVNAHPGEVTIIAVGPLTNVARAVMIDPTLPGKLAGIAIMGGSFGVKHRPQELNFGYDPEAAQIVVTCGAKIVLVPLDTTLLTDPAAASFRAALLRNGRLEACVFLGREPALPARDWLVGCFDHATLPQAARRALLAGREPGAATAEPPVCVCLGIGAAAIAAAIASGCDTVEAVGAATRAGTNCGSCRPEIRIALAAQTPVPA